MPKSLRFTLPVEGKDTQNKIIRLKQNKIASIYLHKNI